MGEVFAGRYELADPIGRGGVGAVWRAWDHRRRRYVAAKVLQQSDAHALLRFVREQALRIDHPHVLAPASWAADDDKVLFTMDLVAGGSLVHLVGDYGPLPPVFVCTLLDQLLSGLTAVHAEGVVHRDIKPANILLEATGTARPRLRLSDFGIAMRLGEPRLTETNLVVGTPGYLAPEQMMGSDPDFPADLFAVGLVALYLLEGAKPDAKALVQYFAEHGTPGAPKSVPEPLWQVVATLLQPDPQARFRTATGARKALAAAAELLPEPGPDDELIEIFDQLGPLPPGFGPDGPPRRPRPPTSLSPHPHTTPEPHPHTAPEPDRPSTPPDPEGGPSTSEAGGPYGTSEAGGPRASGRGHLSNPREPAGRAAALGPDGPAPASGPGERGAASGPGGSGAAPGAGRPVTPPGPAGPGAAPGSEPPGGTPRPAAQGTGPLPARPGAAPGTAPTGTGSLPSGPAAAAAAVHPGTGGLPSRPNRAPDPAHPGAGTGSGMGTGAGSGSGVGTGTGAGSGSGVGTGTGAGSGSGVGTGTGAGDGTGNGTGGAWSGGGSVPSAPSVPGHAPGFGPNDPRQEPDPTPTDPRRPTRPTPRSAASAPTPAPSMSDTGSFHLPPPRPATGSFPGPGDAEPSPPHPPAYAPTPGPMAAPPYEPTFVLPTRGRHGEGSTASYTAQDPPHAQAPHAPQALSTPQVVSPHGRRRGHRAARRPGPPAGIALPLLFLALACYAVGFWALTRI
ncbi:serine/threonine protein kinase [Streptomyces sp. 3330]|uniref:serine/threonine-protein kinase n=1 Tax=Streptomyces sp. 3330 TaxID=2817755 RepID=UPI0028670B96|nr:protein kinase [Streptomyces sp. 3330]MDR6976971.1 serine/threonine protein kinase [Streptomyces sp. 3330]